MTGLSPAREESKRAHAGVVAALDFGVPAGSVRRSFAGGASSSTSSSGVLATGGGGVGVVIAVGYEVGSCFGSVLARWLLSALDANETPTATAMSAPAASHF